MSLYQLPIENSSSTITIGSFRDFYTFEQHVSTCRAKRGLEMVPEWYQQPVFYFSNAASIVGDGAKISAPAGCQELDYELEIGVVISKEGRNIPAHRAWDYVAGFTIVNDFSARDLQRQEMKVGLGPSKGKDFATAIGPSLVPLGKLRNRIDDRQQIDMEMSARINDMVFSLGNANTMYFSWPQIIAHASKDATLLPGDLLGSGTVGTGCILELGPETTGGWLKPGDVVELSIKGLGTLRNKITEPNSS